MNRCLCEEPLNDLFFKEASLRIVDKIGNWSVVVQLVGADSLVLTSGLSSSNGNTPPHEATFRPVSFVYHIGIDKNRWYPVWMCSEVCPIESLTCSREKIEATVRWTDHDYNKVSFSTLRKICNYSSILQLWGGDCVVITRKKGRFLSGCEAHVRVRFFLASSRGVLLGRNKAVESLRTPTLWLWNTGTEHDLPAISQCTLTRYADWDWTVPMYQ